MTEEPMTEEPRTYQLEGPAAIFYNGHYMGSTSDGCKHVWKALSAVELDRIVLKIEKQEADPDSYDFTGGEICQKCCKINLTLTDYGQLKMEQKWDRLSMSAMALSKGLPNPDATIKGSTYQVEQTAAPGQPEVLRRVEGGMAPTEQDQPNKPNRAERRKKQFQKGERTVNKTIKKGMRWRR